MKIIRTIAKWALSLLLIAVIISWGLWLLNSPIEFDQASLSQQRLDAGAYKVERIDLKIVDQSRTTPAMGKYDGDDTRTLNGSIWYPSSNDSNTPAEKHPLIVFSHGFGSYHQGCRHIAQFLARNGYVVAAVDFPLSYMRSPAGSPQLLDVANQPGDVSAVIDRLLELDQDAKSPLHKRIDTEKIGAMGLSLGGLTTALVSFHPDLKDDRIDAMAAFAPPLEAFSAEFFATNDLPSLVISGSQDKIVPESVNATEIQAMHPNGLFLSVEGGTHLGFANVGSWLRMTESPDNLGCTLIDYNLEKLTLPESWSEVIPNTNGILRDISVGEPCPELAGIAMNPTKQQWLTRVAVGAFFDMNLRTGDRAESARQYFRQQMVSENSELTLKGPS
ncbi:MAG: dienelactone hydrolase [Cryomorphaceae bacterium]|jgi:dienelactone hydrolase